MKLSVSHSTPAHSSRGHAARPPSHFVQFYERDEFLVDAVAQFIASALDGTGTGIVIATPAHREQLALLLAQMGYDIDLLRASGNLVLLDAAEALSWFMRDGRPDPILFRATVGAPLHNAAARGHVLAFGEMVALLWADGLTEAALELECLLNSLSAEYDFSLLCAYPIGGFSGDASGVAFEHVCATHRHVIPAETYLSCADLSSQWRSVARLQQRAFALNRERSLRRDAERSVSVLRWIDRSTGLMNRFAFHELLQAAIAHAHAAQESVVLLHIDVDRFQRLNDTLGPATGDTLLGILARRLRNCVRSEDIVARLNGDEFAVLLTGTSASDDALPLAERIQGSLSGPLAVGGYSVIATVSVGIVMCPADATDTDQLLAAADLAVHDAKRRGSNCVSRFAASLRHELQASLSLEVRLREALTRNEFHLVFQPVYSLQTDAVTAVEALLRWQPADGSSVSPAVFIPAAEQSGLIVPLGEWVLRSACRQGRRWMDAGFGELKVLVNVSVMQLEQPNLIGMVTSIARQSGFPLRNLVFEITESVFLHDTELTTARLAGLRALGVQISLDDFGTGYSCLSYLKRLPLDKLKIDRSFIKDVAGTASNAAIVSAILEMGKSLGLEVVAEGVETSVQLAKLRELHCPYVQGSFFSPPVVAEQIPLLLPPLARSTG